MLLTDTLLTAAVFVTAIATIWLTVAFPLYVNAISIVAFKIGRLITCCRVIHRINSKFPIEWYNSRISFSLNKIRTAIMFVAVILAINFAVTSVSVIYTFSIFAGKFALVITSYKCFEFLRTSFLNVLTC